MTRSWKNEVIGRIERAARRGRRPRPDFDEAFALARAIALEDGPAIANPAVRAAGRLVRAQPGAPQLRNCSALSHGASFAPNLMDMGDVIRDVGLAPCARPSRRHCSTLRADESVAAATRS